MRLSSYRWIAPVPGCLALQFSFGSFYAMGVFVSRLGIPSVTYALGYSAALLSVSLTAAGMYLHRRPPPDSPAKSLAFLSAALLAIAAFLPAFSSTESPTGLLYVASAALGAGYGVVYVVSISVLQAWVPERPGTATGAAVSVGGIGTLFYVALNTAFCNLYPKDIPRAMRYSCALQTGIALSAASSITMPPSPTWTPLLDQRAGSPESEPNERSPIYSVNDRGGRRDPKPGLVGGDVSFADTGGKRTCVQSQFEKEASGNVNPGQNRAMKVREMLNEPVFYLLLATVTSSVGPGFGVALHGSRMQTALFGLTEADADSRFFYVTLIGVCGRLIVGMAVDAYAAAKTASSRSCSHACLPVASSEILNNVTNATDLSFHGAKLLNVVLLVAQTCSLALSFVFIRFGNSFLFAVAISTIYLTFSGASVLMACLCRAAFSPINSTLAFSLVGLAIGAGDVFFSALVARCAEKAPLLGSYPHSANPNVIASHAGDYNSYFLVSLLVSLAGLGTVVMLKPASGRIQTLSDGSCHKVYRQGSQ